MAGTNDSDNTKTTAASDSNRGSAKSERTPDQDGVREHAIREAAYRRFEARNGAPGDEKQDWLDAQAEVDGQ